MTIRFTKSFQNRLLNQIDFISQDSPSRARKFQREIIKSIEKITKNPYSCRKSIYFDDTKIRDLVFKGYTIVFIISENTITVFGFVKFQNTIQD